jgi:uncharacterized protein with HEPN domain
VKDNKFYLIHINECIDDVAAYTADGYDTFMGSTLVQDAVIRKLQIMAESTMPLPEEMRTAHPEVNWRDIRGFHNVVVHDYTEVDQGKVWDIVQNDLPGLKSAVEALMGDMGGIETRPPDKR